MVRESIVLISFINRYMVKKQIKNNQNLSPSVFTLSM